MLCTRLKRSVCLRVIEWKYDMCVCVCLCVRAREAGRDCVQYNRAQLWSCESRRSDKGCDLARVLSLSLSSSSLSILHLIACLPRASTPPLHSLNFSVA